MAVFAYSFSWVSLFYITIRGSFWNFSLGYISTTGATQWCRSQVKLTSGFLSWLFSVMFPKSKTRMSLEWGEYFPFNLPPPFPIDVFFFTDSSSPVFFVSSFMVSWERKPLFHQKPAFWISHFLLWFLSEMTRADISMQEISLCWHCLILPFPLVHLRSSIIIKSEGEIWKKKLHLECMEHLCCCCYCCLSVAAVACFYCLSSHHRDCRGTLSSSWAEASSVLSLNVTVNTVGVFIIVY